VTRPSDRRRKSRPPPAPIAGRSCTRASRRATPLPSPSSSNADGGGVAVLHSAFVTAIAWTAVTSPPRIRETTAPPLDGATPPRAAPQATPQAASPWPPSEGWKGPSFAVYTACSAPRTRRDPGGLQLATPRISVWVGWRVWWRPRVDTCPIDHHPPKCESC